jgi:hypothetical protein
MTKKKTPNTCNALLGSYGFKNFDTTVFHCQLPKGHEGLHEYKGDWPDKGGKWAMVWEGDGRHLCASCGKVIGLFDGCDSYELGYKLKGQDNVWVGDGCACLECAAKGTVKGRKCPVCKGTGLKV